MDLAYEPGTKSLYSDLGLFLLGEVLERVAGRPLDEIARQGIFSPLAIRDTGYRPPPALLPRIAPTEVDPWRGHPLPIAIPAVHSDEWEGRPALGGEFASVHPLGRFLQRSLYW